MVRGFNLKLVAICLMMLFIFQIAFPTVSFALTGGPSAPETSAFTPVGASDLVDLSTGDFSYNIPLMTVPGPNGGYPINMGYKAGSTMEQEASWVGLGWDLNVGSVNRSLRGLPDDFKGDVIENKISYADNKTRTFNFSINPLLVFKPKERELFWGLNTTDFTSLNVSVGYNNYTGLSGGLGANFSVSNFQVGVDYDSKDGISVNPSVSSKKSILKLFNGLSGSFSTSAGFTGINFSKTINSNGTLNIPFSAGMSFAKIAPLGEISAEQKIVSENYGAGFGTYEKNAPNQKYKEYYNPRYGQTIVSLKSKSFPVKGYGYNNLEFATEDDLMDFHKEKVSGNYEKTPITYIPSLDYDVYSVTGQGVAGSFRAYRNDIPMLSNRKVVTTKETKGINGSLGVTPGFSIDLSGTKGNGASMTGKWGVNGSRKGKIETLNENIKLEGKDINHPLYQPFSFEYMNNQVESNEAYYNSIEKDKPVHFHLYKGARNNEVQDISSRYGQLSKADFNKKMRTDKTLDRTVNNNHIGYKTKGEFFTEANPDKYKNIVSENQNPLTAPPTSSIDYSSKGSDHHIHEISVTNTSGTKYVYGLPVYNTSKEDVVFSVDGQSSNPNTINYSSTDATTGNSKGLSKYFKSTKLKDYTTAHLLTATYSDDYVDLTNNGPTEDDFGYWCKFNYSPINTTTNEIEWRAPYTGASYIKGNHSDSEDDMASYTYGTKQQYYVNSIETKTHIALFEIDEREDNRGALGRDVQNGTQPIATTASTKYLKSITLYSKADPTNPIKTVHLQYDYSLCSGVSNRVSLGASNDPDHILNNTGTGKLTLKKVYFTHQKSSRGALTPYQFEYGENPAYQYLTNTDRWGNMNVIPTGNTNKSFPYTNQSENLSARDANSAAWNLSKINLPSGGNIEVEYESDDYTHVQDKRAGQMFILQGFSRNLEGDPIPPILDRNKFNVIAGSIIKKVMYFKKPDGSNISKSEVSDYIKDLKYVYFKSYVKLRASNSDYVSGYFEIDKSGDYGANGNLGYFTVKPSKYDKTKINPGGNDIHPIQLAACQHIHTRVDILPKIANPVSQLKMLFRGPVTHYRHKMNYCNKIDDSKPSFIRLSASSKGKYGGGHRVSSVKVNTGWGETYGQKYSYKLAQSETSSGVSDYEPMVGGEEISLRVPESYSGTLENSGLINESPMFVEKPYMEVFYPSPVVRYARVVTEAITPKDLDNTSTEKISNQGGITVNEYYTAKDFPVITDKSIKNSMTVHKMRAVPIPFTFDVPMQRSDAHSQGFVVELNDMPGKPKSVATFSYSDKSNLTTKDAKTYVEYKYHRNGNKLTNNVLVLKGDMDFQESTIGRKEEFYVHQQEDFDYNKVTTGGASFGFTPAVIDHFMPIIKRNRSIMQKRTLVTNKVITRKGILQEVLTKDNGRTTVSKNLAYDAYSGEALVQTQENDFDKPVYSYNYNGHWKYPSLGGKYKNYRATFKAGGQAGVNTIDATNPPPVEELLQLGDILQWKEGTVFKQGFVTNMDTDNNTFAVQNLNGISITVSNKTLTIIQSGYRNLQSVKVGNIVSLENPINFPNPSTHFLNDVYNTLKSNLFSTPMNFVGSCNNLDYTIDLSSPYLKQLSGSKYELEIPVSGSDNGGNPINCAVLFRYNIFLAEGEGSTTVPDASNLTYISKTKINDKQYRIKYSYHNGQETVTDYGILETTCELECDIKVLHASATELSDDWSYDYADLGNPEIKKLDGNYYPLETTSFNKYAFGEKGRWRAKRSWVNQVDRLQKGTKGYESEISTDGEYETFKVFKWDATSLNKNEKNKWAWTTLMTKYSPFGYQLENENPLHIFSSELYGYDNSLVTAVGANANYNEIAFTALESNLSATSPILQSKTGHFEGINNVVDWQAHTGKYSYHVDSDIISSYNLQLQPTKKYLFSCWVWQRGADEPITINIKQKGSSTVIETRTISPPTANYVAKSGNVIDGWSKIDIPFDNVTGNIDIEFSVSNGAFRLVDDLRIHPFNSSFKSFVYEPNSLRLISELDNLNYATFYRYDEEGKLIQVQKDTDLGRVSVKNTRDNIAH